MKVIKSEKLSTAWEPRYVIIDEATNEVLDDAQGYGYKSSQSAYKAWEYKTNKKTRKRVNKRKYQGRAFSRWWEKHAEFRDRVEEIMFYAAEDEAHGIAYTDEEIFEACQSVAQEMGVEGFKKEMLT